jgi:hypothetical protein
MSPKKIFSLIPFLWLFVIILGLISLIFIKTDNVPILKIIAYSLVVYSCVLIPLTIWATFGLFQKCERNYNQKSKADKSNRVIKSGIPPLCCCVLGYILHQIKKVPNFIYFRWYRINQSCKTKNCFNRFTHFKHPSNKD